MVNKVITNLDSSKAFGLGFIPMVVLKNCESELSYILAELLSEGVVFFRLYVGLINCPCI